MAALKSALQLPANQFERFYRGGPAIAALRGVPSPGDRFPEDWVGSVTAAFGSAGDGLTTLPGGRLLCDAIAADPESFLGAAHVARFGPDPTLLVKLLDAGERLPVHLHPDGDFARRELGSPYGKTEAWIVVSAEPGALVQLGFRYGVRGRRSRTGSSARTWVRCSTRCTRWPSRRATWCSCRPARPTRSAKAC